MADFSKIKVGERVITHFSTRGTPFFETAKVIKVLKHYFVTEVDKSDNPTRIGAKCMYNFDGGRRGEARNAWGRGTAPARPYDEHYVQKYEAAKNRWDMIQSITKQTDGAILVEMTDEELLKLLNHLCVLSGKREARRLAKIEADEAEKLANKVKLLGLIAMLALHNADPVEYKRATDMSIKKLNEVIDALRFKVDDKECYDLYTQAVHSEDTLEVYRTAMRYAQRYSLK